MLHIIILNKGYFPEKLRGGNTAKDKVVVLAMASDSIPVSAYQNDMLSNMEVKLLPEFNDPTSAEGKNVLRIAQAMFIGQLTATEKEYEIYSDDDALLKALTPFTGKKVPAKKQVKKTVEKPEPLKTEDKPKEDKKKTSMASSKKKTEKKEAPAPKKQPMVSSETVKAIRSGKKETSSKEAPQKVEKPAKKKGEATGKLPTQAQVKKVIGAANSSYAKLIHDTLKKSNQITFEMNVRMELAKAGLGAGACQELAKTLNDEFGKLLPTS